MWSSIAVSTVLAALLLGGASLLSRVRFGPIAGHWWVPRLRLRAEAALRFGQVGSSAVPLAMAVDAEGGESLCGAGRLVARGWFARGAPVLEVRVLAATAAPRGWSRRGQWADAGSLWHGVTFGVIEVERETELQGQTPTQGRRPGAPLPFGVTEEGSPMAGDLARLVSGCACYLGAYLYGVPLGALAAIEQATARAIEEGTLATGAVESVEWQGRSWRRIDLPRLLFPSAARARQDGRELVTPDATLARAWRSRLGHAPPSESIERSFPMVPLALRLWVSTRLDHDPVLDPTTAARLVTTVLVTSAGADRPDEERDALLVAQQEALGDWLRELNDEERAAPAA